MGLINAEANEADGCVGHALILGAYAIVLYEIWGSVDDRRC